MTQERKLEKLEKKFNRKITFIEKKLTTAYRRGDALGFHLYEGRIQAVVNSYLDKRAKIEKCPGYMVDVEIGFANHSAKIDVSIEPGNAVECTFDEFAEFFKEYQLSEGKEKSAESNGVDKAEENSATVKVEEHKSNENAEGKASVKETSKEKQ